MLKTEPILTQSNVENRLLETLRLFLEVYREMPQYHREIVFDILREVVKHPRPIELEFYNKKKENETIRKELMDKLE